MLETGRRVGELDGYWFGASDRDDAIQLVDGPLSLVSFVEPHEAHPLRNPCVQ